MKFTAKTILIVFIVVIIIVAAFVYMLARKRYVDIGDGNDIPANWNPQPDTIAVFNSMDGVGTDEELFFNTVNPLSKGQIRVLYNTYLDNYGHSILQDIQSEFSGADLQRALYYFKDIEGAGFKPLRTVAS